MSTSSTLPYLLLLVNLISARASNLRADKLSVSPIFYCPESSSVRTPVSGGSIKILSASIS